MLWRRNILADAKLYDLWQVNADAEYHEQGDEVSDEKNGSGLRLVPARVDRDREPELASKLKSAEFFDRRAGAEQIPVAVTLSILATDGQNLCSRVQGAGKRGLLARVGAIPFFRSNLLRGVRRIFQQIVLPVSFSVCDRIDFGAN